MPKMPKNLETILKTPHFRNSFRNFRHFRHLDILDI